MTHTVLRWIGGAVAGAGIVVAALAAWTYTASERHLRSFPAPPPFTHPIATDSGAVSRGEHLVRTRGCRGCHGDQLQGELMWGMAVAPNLAEYARRETASTLEAALRHGIGAGGRALYSMPSYNFVRLRDRDVTDMIAYLRAIPVVHAELPRASLPWTVRWEIARGLDAAMPRYLDQVPPLRRTEDPDPAIVRGEYIAMTSCNECHGFGLRADTPWDDGSAPDLAIVSGYSPRAFTTLMRTGLPIGGRELALMSGVARTRFAYFTDGEIADLYAFLRDLGRRAMADAGPAGKN